MLVLLKTKEYKSELNPKFMEKDCDSFTSPLIRVAVDRFVVVEAGDVMLLEEKESCATLVTLRNGKELYINEGINAVAKKIAMGKGGVPIYEQEKSDGI